MTGTFLNVAGILAGCILAFAKARPLSLSNQFFFKMVLGLATVFCGLHLTWIGLSSGGSFLQVLKALGILVVALMLGKPTGKLLRLQKTSNRLGQFARERIAAAKPDNPRRASDGFNVCAILFCAAPLGILGAIHDGLSGYVGPLAIKAVMDGLAAMSFVAMFGWGVMLSAVPVLVFQGGITLVCARVLLPFLQSHHLVHSITAIGGILVFCVALVIFEIKKVEVTDYLPGLIFAPLLTWWLG